ncbi:MAG: glycosyltransferase family 2 protein [Betaproteobacteria bacterium]|nr:glycosyltransferase family 2 protein [Betaproteobacteria bacterium]
MSEDADVPAISFVTTCKGRLAHLKQSLPRLAAQAEAEVIVVDYDCPECAGAWVAGNFPEVRVVSVKDAPIFNVSRARNQGGQAARGEWLCFVDADIQLDEHFAARALPLLQEGAFYLMASPRPDTFGTVVCLRSDFQALSGYDEVLQGYATEDRDFYIRLTLLGRVRQMLPGEWVKAIAHDRDASVRYHEIKDHSLNQRINATYVQIKHDLTRQFGGIALPAATRQMVYAEVSRALQHAAATGQPRARVEVTLPADLVVRLYGWQMKRVWTYLIEPMPQQPAPGPGIVAGGIPGWRAGVADEKGTIPG